MTKVSTTEWRLDCSGRVFYAYGLTLAISPDGTVRYGWDGDVDGVDSFTAEERAELAEHMIGLWKRFKEA